MRTHLAEYLVRPRPVALRLTALVAAAATGALATVAMLATTAEAYPSDCPSDIHVISSPATNGRGVRVFNPGMFVKDTNPPCARASAIADVNSSESTFVEFGWYDETFTGASPCTPTSGPAQLIVWQINWAYTCKQATPLIYPPTNGTWYVWVVSDQNQDGVWKWVFNGNQLHSQNMGTFITGDPRANAERKSLSDSNYADFYGLYRMGSGGSWYGWSSVSVLKDTDVEYRNCWYSSSLRVIVKKGTC